jgi:hypothetical protein
MLNTAKSHVQVQTEKTKAKAIQVNGLYFYGSMAGLGGWSRLGVLIHLRAVFVWCTLMQGIPKSHR